MNNEVGLTQVDYIVAILMLLIPLGIGVLFAVKDHKRSTREEYLLGGRRMSLVPVTLSLFVTFQSAISMLGVPSEVYTYGAMFSTIYLGFSLSYVFGYFTIVPVMYPLRLTSIYEYLHIRFESQTVRIVSTIVGMTQTLFYMAVVLLSPALALQAVAEIPLWMSVAIVGAIGTIYTVLGGIKSVVWTDAFQTIVVFTGLLAIIIKGFLTVGGLAEALSIAKEGGRLSFDVINPDPRTRHSWWGMLLGSMFTWLTNVFSQSSIQRISAMRNIKDARRSFLLNVPINIIFGILLLLVGIVIYTYFAHVRCDPIESGLISNRNQLVPFYVLQAMRELPGMTGLYMATLFSGSLSTISSGINALAANTIEDLLKTQLQSLTEHAATLVTKLIVLVYGILMICIAYGANSLKGSVTQLAVSVFGACGSPLLGMFLMGCCVPWANKFGALVGGVVSLTLNLIIALGNQFYGRKLRTLPPAHSDMCSNISFPINSTHISYTDVNSSSFFTSTFMSVTTESPTETNSLTSHLTKADSEETELYENGFFLYDISYEWYGFIGTMVCILVGLAVSLLTRRFITTAPESKLFVPFLRHYLSLTEHKSEISPANSVKWPSDTGKILTPEEENLLSRREKWPNSEPRKKDTAAIINVRSIK